MRKDWEYKKLGECTNIEYGTRVVQKKMEVRYILFTEEVVKLLE